MAENDKPVILEQKDFDLLTQKLGDEANKKINSLFAEAEKGNKDALTELKAKIAELSTIEGKSIAEFVKNVQEQTNKLEGELKANLKGQIKTKSFAEEISENIISSFDMLTKAAKNEKVPFEFKAAIDHSIVDSVGAGVIPLQYESGIAAIAKRNPTLYDVLSKVPWASSTVNWVEVATEEGTIAAKREAAASYAGNYDAYSKFPQRSYTWAKRSMDLSKIPAYAKITEEMMENAQNLVAFVQSELIRDVLLALDNDILKGNGTAPNMKGLQHSDYYTAAAVPGNYELPSGVTPNETDVLRAIITQQLNAYFNPGVILMHPTDVMKMDLAKDKNGQAYIAPFSSNGNTLIKGVPIVQYANLTEGTFHVIDPTRVQLFIQRGLTLRLWDQVGNDPLYDLMTMTASVKAGVRVKTNEKAANIYGNFATLIAAMTASES